MNNNPYIFRLAFVLQKLEVLVIEERWRVNRIYIERMMGEL